MKIRSGFVSNSSSCSFYIGYDTKEPPKVEEILKLIGFTKDNVGYKYIYEFFKDMLKNGENIDDEEREWWMKNNNALGKKKNIIVYLLHNDSDDVAESFMFNIPKFERSNDKILIMKGDM